MKITASDASKISADNQPKTDHAKVEAVVKEAELYISAAAHKGLRKISLSSMFCRNTSIETIFAVISKIRDAGFRVQYSGGTIFINWD